MALTDKAWYVNYGNGSSTGYYAVAAWTALTTYDCGTLVRQLAAPAVGSERVFVAVVGHVASGAAEPTWVITRGGKTTDATITWQEATGIAALNGDLTNTPSWTTVKNTAVTLGQVIKNVAGTLILICTTAGTAGNGSEPSWAAYTTAGATTADNTATWTTLGASFSAWAAPHARLANSFTSTWGQGGNSFYVGDNHAETQASAITLTSPGTASTRCLVYCADHTQSTPPSTSNLLTTGTITATSTNLITMKGYVYYYGLTFTASSVINIGLTTSNGDFIFDNCTLALSSTGTAIQGGATNGSNGVLMNNTVVSFGSVSQSILFNAHRWEWKNTLSALAGSVPTTLFGVSVGNCSILKLQGVDLSAMGSGKTIIGARTDSFDGKLIDCKLGASVTVSAAPAVQSASIDVIRSDSAGTNYQQQRYLYQGTLTPETTIIRTGGASDGTTALAWKIVTTANNSWLSPFQSLPIAIWNTSTSAITTLTFYGTTTGGGVPNNDDIWVEVEYLGSGSSPLGSFITSTKANNIAASTTTNNSSDASIWGGSGAGNGFKIVVPSFTPAQAGPLNIVIKVAKASSTYYIDPRPVITAGPAIQRSEIVAPGVYVNEIQMQSARSLVLTRGTPY